MATFARGYWTRRTDARNKATSITHPTHSTTPGKVTWQLDPSDTLTLRGIPAIGRGVPGRIAGTRPDRIADK